MRLYNCLVIGEEPAKQLLQFSYEFEEPEYDEGCRCWCPRCNTADPDCDICEGKGSYKNTFNRNSKFEWCYPYIGPIDEGKGYFLLKKGGTTSQARKKDIDILHLLAKFSRCHIRAILVDDKWHDYSGDEDQWPKDVAKFVEDASSESLFSAYMYFT